LDITNYNSLLQRNAPETSSTLHAPEPEVSYVSMHEFEQNMDSVKTCLENLTRELRESHNYRQRSRTPQRRSETRSRSRSPISHHVPSPLQSPSVGSVHNLTQEEQDYDSLSPIATVCSPEILSAIHEVWPDVTPVWHVSAEILQLIQKKPTPPLYLVPENASCDAEGVYFDEIHVGPEETFLGDWKGKAVIAFWIRNFTADHLMSRLKVVNFQDKHKFSVASHNSNANNLLNWVDLSDDGWIPQTAKGQFHLGGAYKFPHERIVNKDFSEQNNSNPTPWHKFASSDPPTNEILSFLFSDKLGAKAHVLPNISQGITIPLDSTSRERDFRVRQRAGSFFNLHFSLKLIKAILAKLTNHKMNEEERASTISKLLTFVDGTIQASSPLADFFLKDAAFIRLSNRKKSGAKIKDPDVFQTLINGPLLTPSLFHHEALEELSLKLERPAPRNVKLNEAKKTPPSNKNSMPFHAQHYSTKTATPTFRQWRGNASNFRGHRGRGGHPGFTDRGAHSTSRRPNNSSQARGTNSTNFNPRGRPSSAGPASRGRGRGRQF